MYEVMVIATVILMTIAAVDYIRCAWKGISDPVPATWILIVVGMTLSLWMYWVSPQKSWTANIGVVSAFANTSAILVGVIVASIKHHTFIIAFNKTQKWCLAGGGGVVVFWFFTDQPLASYILVQTIILIGYIATAKRLWKAERCTEPIFVWSAVLLGSLTALYPAWAKSDLFAWIFLARAIPCTIFLIYLIMRVQRRAQTTNIISNIQKKEA